MDESSNSSQQARSKIIMVVSWVMILGIGVVVYKFVIAPRLAGKLVQQTSSQTRYDHDIRIAQS